MAERAWQREHGRESMAERAWQREHGGCLNHQIHMIYIHMNSTNEQSVWTAA
jgi:hypothetical protein